MNVILYVAALMMSVYYLPMFFAVPVIFVIMFIFHAFFNPEGL